WVPEREVRSRAQAREGTREWFVGWRNICRATDERTGIFSVIPHTGVDHSLHLMMFNEHDPQNVAVVLASMNSLACDYVTRLKVAGVNFTFGYLRQIAVPAPSSLGEKDF